MPYDIKLPDGGTLANIPDSVDPKQAYGQWKANWVEQNYSAETPSGDVSLQDIEKQRGEEFSTAERLGVGFQSGLRNIGRNVGNMVGAVDDAELQAATDLENPMTQGSAAGAIGKLGGEVAALAPLGGVGGLGRAAGRLALPNAGKAVAAAQGLARSRTAALAAEGALGGAITGEANNRGTNAALGAGIGGGLGAIGASMKGSVVDASEEALKLEQKIGKYLPLHMAAKDEGSSGIAKFIYGKALPYLPGSKNITKGALDADEAIKQVAIKMASPEGIDATDVRSLAKAFEDGYTAFNGKSLGGLTDDIFSGLPKNTITKMRTALNDTAIDLNNIKGSDLVHMRRKLSDLVGTKSGQGFEKAIDNLDAFAYKSLHSKSGRSISSANQEAFDVYTSLNGKYDRLAKLVRADSTKGGVTPNNLRAATKTADDEMREFGELASKVAGEGLPDPSLWGRMAAIASVTAGSGALAGPAGIAAPWLLGKGLSASATQRALMGRTGLQRAVKAGKNMVPGSVLNQELISLYGEE